MYENYSIMQREEIGRTPTTSGMILEKLSKDNFSSVRYAVAQNTGCPPHVLKELSKDKD